VGWSWIYTPGDRSPEGRGFRRGEIGDIDTAAFALAPNWVIWHRGVHSLVPATNVLVLLSPNLPPMMARQGRSGVETAYMK